VKFESRRSGFIPRSLNDSHTVSRHSVLSNCYGVLAKAASAIERCLWLFWFCTIVTNLGLAHETPHVAADSYQPPSERLIVGEGEFRFQYLPGWGSEAAAKLSLGHCHAMVVDRSGCLYLANTNPDYCIVVLDESGQLLDRWGDFAPQAHGLTLSLENGEEFLYITTNDKNGKVIKTNLGGDILMTISCPVESGLYESVDDFRPSKTIVLPGGELLVLDGYGRDYVLRFSAEGKYLSAFGGDLGDGEARLDHWGPHGGGLDLSDPQNPVLILAMSDQQTLKRFTLGGKWIDRIPLPGGNPRDIAFFDDHIVIPHLGDNWPEDRNAAGFISFLDRDFDVVANLGGKNRRDDNGKLVGLQHNSHLFHHPHGIVFDQRGNLYVAQFASNGTFPLKFERIVSDH